MIVTENKEVLKLSGWQGITVECPDAWNLVSYGGDNHSGNMRLDNSGADGTNLLGVEVRWTQTKKALTAVNIEDRVQQYLDSIAKDAKRRRVKFDGKTKLVGDDASEERIGTRGFDWRTDRKGVGQIWYCNECGRVVIAQVVTNNLKVTPDSAHVVLNSIRCHPLPDGWTRWSLYDLSSEVPSEYSLKRQPQLMNIYVQLGFGAGHSTDTVVLEQWGVANIQLRGAYLDQWFDKKCAASLRHLKLDRIEDDANGHPALMVSGRRGGLVYWLGEGLQSLVRLQKPAVHFAACLWECPVRNKIFLVQCNGRTKRSELVRQIVERTTCH